MAHRSDDELGEVQGGGLERRVRALERQRNLLAAVGAGTLALLLLGTAPWSRPQDDDVLRVRGIIIEDDDGRERILIGAPIPVVEHRIRTDPEKVAKAWGHRYPDMKWFEKLDHSTNGMLILDKAGHDRIVVGDPTPDPNVGKRLAPGSGLAINDEEGIERSGWGYFEKTGAVGLGLDHRSGEGLNLFLQPDGTAGILIRDEGANLTFLGHAPAGNWASGLAAEVNGLVLRDRNGPRLVLDSAGEPAVEIRDGAGAVVQRLASD